ncbi:DotU/TssL family secretion system protein [Pseudomonas syringae pv. actinidiae]|uniref:Type VI protein secretion system component VasF n=2 Tax=Pseudomonas syringae TaxID=317 RepID=A0A2V0QXE7_PSESF|nr:DotU/TssL family secretion system protein [Pseudomonas syringae]EPN73154.1 type VI secretion protein DotU [Pseudomonas syringae pv. actinidiae ICMP 19101]AKT30535.1 type VI secretion system protein ImpK [Pseudomonas syringae pv. actinidiae ICMP 18884]AOE56964.1 type VI secretion system protein ImpK [Pseudomonas syringae pv. actinidiae ICMP 18708]APP97924.1 type VI secretion system protein ImpK [Pseudomonas syringae pv. actinidiae]APQ03677.1 type VI secretion system protein ImpK [Pseudomonas
MPEGNAVARSRAVQEAPLSHAFRQAWQEWLSAWRELDKSVEDTGKLVDTVVELSTRITRRLWRTAFASVGDSATLQMKAMVYAFVALVDETLLFADWSGQSAWQEKPLESRLYSSRQAGQRVPLEIKRLLDEQAPTSRDLGNVYLLCLILGFQGHLRGERGRALHEKWRNALYTFTRQREPDFTNVSQQLTEPASAAARTLALRQSMPDGMRLALIILLATVLLIGVGHLFWRDIGQRLEPAFNSGSISSTTEQPQ